MSYTFPPSETLTVDGVLSSLAFEAHDRRERMNELTPCELRDANLIWKLFDEEERIIEDALQYAKSDIEGRLRASDGMCGPREYCIFAIRTIQKYQHENAYRRQRVRAVRRLLSQRPELRERIVQFELAMGR